MSLRVLGELSVERGAERLPLPPSRKTRALLGYLLIEPREHTREHLCSLFWDGPDDPRGALRWSLSRLRALVGERLRTEGEHVQLDPADALVDLRGAQDLCARGLAAAGEPALRETAALFRGELLEGLELPDSYRFQSWCTAQRETARRLRGQILATLAQRLSPQPEQALAVARQLVELDPTDESAHRRVMEQLIALGRPREARLQYDACREILRSSLGQSPSPETEAVRRSLGVGAPAPLVAPAVPRPPPLPAPALLVGRAGELAAIERGLARGQRLLLVLGEPGIGKTRLLEETARRARAGGEEVLAGRSYEAEMARPYGVFIDALRASPLAAAAPAPLRHELAALLPELAPGVAPSDRDRFFDAVAALLREAARERTLVVLLDDAHWIDEASASLAHYLTRTLAGARVRIVAAARGGELPDNPAALRLQRALRRDDLLEEIEVSPLGQADVAKLLRGRSADAVRVHGESGGNPLLALEMGRAIEEGRPPVSGSLSEMLEHRFAALDAETQALLPWAAALGSSWTLPLLSAAAGRPEAAVLEALGVLERHALVRARGDAWDFAHDLLREAAWRRVPEARRRTLHAALARTLWSDLASEALASAVARHAALGGDEALAVRASDRAARHALRVFAPEEAYTLAQRALPLLRSIHGPDRLRLHLSLLETIVWSVRLRPERLQSVVVELNELALSSRAAGLADVAIGALKLFSYVSYFREDEGAALASVRRMVAATRPDEDPQVRARTFSAAARCFAQSESNLEEAMRLLEVAEQEASRSSAVELDVSLARGLLFAFRGDEARAVTELQRCGESALQAEDHWRACEAYFALCRLSLERGDGAAALRWASEVLPVAEKMVEGHEPAMARALLALARLAAGSAGDGASPQGAASAEASFSSACRELRSLEALWRLALLLLLRAELELAGGRLDAAQGFAAECEGIQPPDAAGAVQTRVGHCQLVFAEIALAQGDRAGARQRLARSLAAPRSSNARLKARLTALSRQLA